MKRRALIIFLLVSAAWAARPPASMAITAAPPPVAPPATAPPTAAQGATPAPSPVAAKPVPSVPATIRWKNGESITGDIVEASASEVTWKTALFNDPLVLKWSALSRMDQAQPMAQPADPFSFALRDGSHIYGNPVAITGKTISIHSTRHGDVVLKRTEVLSMRRIHGAKLVFAGPLGDEGWEAVSTQNTNEEGLSNWSERDASSKAGAPPPFRPGPGGALLLPYWNRTVRFKTDLPELVDAEFHVHSSARPDFQISFGRNSGARRLRIETWDDQVVMTTASADQFKLIETLPADARDVALRVCWDVKAGKCSVFSPAGDFITDWTLPDSSDITRPGVVLQNKGHDLSLDFLRVRAWDGAPPAKRDVKQPYIELDDGTVIAGAAGDSPKDSITLATQDAGAAPQSWPLDRVDAVVFSTDAPAAAGQETALSFADGTTLTGSITSVSSGTATLKTSFTEDPFTTQMEGLRQLLVKVPAEGTTPEPALDKLDKIVFGKAALHGRLASGGDDKPRWIPVGSTKPATPANTSVMDITRAFPADARFSPAPALFYLSSGDVLPGTLGSLDRSGAEFDSSFIEAKKLDAGDIIAIQFGAGGRVNMNGFDDPGWHVLKGDDKSVRKTKDAFDMDPGTSIGHPSAMQGSEVKFNYEISGFSAIRLRMFCAGTDRTNTKNLVLMSEGNTIISGLETTEGQVESQLQTRVQPGQSVGIKLIVSEQNVELCLNDVSVGKFTIPASKRPGTGLIIEPASLWGNSVNSISLTAFSASSDPGCANLPSVDPNAKKQALTVPRFRRDDPPRHVLVAANGDVLRGEIEAATATNFGFRSGLEDLIVPRDRVKAIIWLKKPAEDAPPASGTKNLASKRLDQTIEQHMGYGGTDLETLIAVLKQEAPDLKFKLPDIDRSTRYSMQFGGQTIADALDTICSMFKLKYRIEGDDTIVLELLSKSSADPVEKVYWMKSNAFPGDTPVEKTLAAKGITFPAGAGATWSPDAKVLSMTNTPENQAKLADLITTDFGGSAGSPTHWLILASGARLALAVDKFDQDTISGHNPAYGRCTVPMSEVFRITTFPPGASAALSSLQDWRLSYAPEPVLPGSGGESSPLLGKPAPTFKLAVLGGGDFDLAKEKGNIIVLDFWATWCGPCIKSLPKLIEAMSAFPADRVKFIGVNQAEPPETVKRFLETRGWKLTVAMDAGQNVSRQYGADEIPHTVIIGPDGKIEWVKTGYTPDGELEAVAAVKKLLAPPAAADPPGK